MDVTFNSRVCMVPAVPDVVRDAIRADLTYTHRRSVRGKEAWELFGKSSGQEFTQRTFVTVQPDGKLIVPAGFTDRICNLLKGFGYQPVKVPHGFTNFKPDWDRLKARMSFRESQEETLQKLVAVYHGGVNAAPGYGKGFLIWCLTELYPEAKFCITADSTVVCRNLRDYLLPYFPDIGMIGGGSKKWHPRVNIYVLDSLHHSDGDEDFLIVDEVHTAVSETASAKFANFRNARRFWFSATPVGRGDNADMRVEALFGNEVVQISYQDCVRMGLVVNLHINWIDMDLPDNPLEFITDSHQRAKFGVWRNVPRNQKLSQVINDIPVDKQSLVLVHRVEHLCNLYPLLNGYKMAFGDNEGSLKEALSWADLGYLDKSELEDRGKKNEQMRKDFARGTLSRVLVTGIWDTGANFPRLRYITRGDPFDSGKIKDVQAPGRGSRLDGDDKDVAYVNDPVDHWDEGMYDMSLGRRRRYNSQGWEQSGWIDRGQST